MPLGTIAFDTIQSGAALTPPVIRDINGTEIGQFCRAWVNFNGTGTVAIRASFNVSSITDNGVGDYTVNFTNAMPDANYNAVVTSTARGGGTSPTSNRCIGFGSASTTNTEGAYSASAVQLYAQNSSGSAGDGTTICVSIFR